MKERIASAVKNFMHYFRKNRTFYLFLLPALLSFLLVLIVPFMLGIYYSFTDWNGIPGRELTFVGFENYVNSFKDDPRFIYSIIITILYTLANIILLNIVSFSLALLVTKNLKLTNIYRVGFFMPNLIGGLILGYIWQFIFIRAIPELLGDLTLPFVSNNILLAEPNTALFALVITGTWQYAGYIMMIYVTAIQNIPKEMTEAAKIDGASPFQRLYNITLPMVAQAFTVTLFLTLVNSFKQFDVNVSLTNGGPSTMFMDKAINGSELLALNIYKSAYNFREFSQAQSKAVMFFFVLMIISMVQVYFSKKREVEL